MVTTLHHRLNGAEVSLCPLQIRHIHTHYRWNNDPLLNRLDSEVPMAREPFRAFRERFEAMAKGASADARDYEIHANGALVGVAWADQINPHSRRCRVGLTIGERDRWRQGLGRATLALLLRHLFLDAGFHRVVAEAFAYNDAWKSLLRQLGFRLEGEARDHLFRDGRFWNKETYALLAPEYTATRALAA